MRLFSRRLLGREADRGESPTAVAEAPARVVARIGESVAPLVGVLGYEALLRRALPLAGAEGPLMVSPGVGDGAVVDPAVPPGTSAAEARVASENVVVHVIRLLVTFMGEDLAFVVVRRAWPNLSSDPDPEETSP